MAKWDGSAWMAAADDVEDDAADPANELNLSVTLSDTHLLIADAGGVLAADLGSLDTLMNLSCDDGQIAKWPTVIP